MKNIIIRIILFFPIVFVFSTCKNTISPTEPATINKGEYSGTFSVTFVNYKNYSHSVTQSGTISILFTDSTYTYSAIANFSSDSATVDSLKDFGSFSSAQDIINMNDVSWLLMNSHWQNSLYFEGVFNIKSSDNQLIISQENNFAKWDLILSLK